MSTPKSNAEWAKFRRNLYTHPDIQSLIKSASETLLSAIPDDADSDEASMALAMIYTAFQDQLQYAIDTRFDEQFSDDEEVEPLPPISPNSVMEFIHAETKEVFRRVPVGELTNEEVLAFMRDTTLEIAEEKGIPEEMVTVRIVDQG